MLRKSVPAAVFTAVSGLVLTLAFAAQPPTGGPPINVELAEDLFSTRCKSCHEPPLERAPSRADMRQRTADDLIAVMTTGAMRPMAQGLTAEDIRTLSIHLTGRQPGQRAPVPIHDVACKVSGPIKASRSDWARFGVDPGNGHFQRSPGFTARQVPRLKLKWAFSYAGGMYGQPTVVGDRLFISSFGGRFYSLDAKTGCVHWMVETIPAQPQPMRIVSRTSPTIVFRPDISPSGWLTVLAFNNNILVAFDAANGKEIWRTERIETVGMPRLTATPAVHGDQVIATVSSTEEGGGTGANYACCVFRGSVQAFDLKTGTRNWNTAVITESLAPTRRNASGTQLQGPAGAAIWAAPAIDEKRGQVIVATGDSYTDADTTGADAIIALDLKTGRIKWNAQTLKGDNFMVGCNRPNPRTGTFPANCPMPTGPDFDYGAAPVVRARPDGKGDIILAGQKSGVAYGIDPVSGAVVWSTKVGEGSTLGGIQWGIAADDRYVYVPNSDLIVTHEVALRALGQMAPTRTPPPEAKPGLTALEISTGKIVWHVPAPRVPCNWGPETSKSRAPGCFNAQSAAASVIPGAVFSGTTDGRFRAYEAATGRVIWEYDTTAQTYDTVNGVKGQRGGSIDGMGPVAAGGMVYTMSGYSGSAGTGSNPTNVLLAFSVDGK